MKSLLPLLIFPITVSAQTVTGTYFQSDDSDSFNVYQYSVGVQYDHLGVEVSHLRFTSPGFSENGQRLATTGRYSWDDTSLTYNVGVLNIGRNIVTGHVYGRHQIDSIWAVEAGVERNVIDSQAGLEAEEASNTTFVVLEAATAGPGFVTVLGHTDYPGDSRRFMRAKIYYTIDDTHGITPYIRRYQYTHSNPDQWPSLYFSPSRYHQDLIGVSWRTAVVGGVFSGHLDYGRQTVSGERYRSRTWRAAYTQQRESFSWSVVALSSHDQPDYRYSTFMAQINVPF